MSTELDLEIAAGYAPDVVNPQLIFSRKVAEAGKFFGADADDGTRAAFTEQSYVRRLIAIHGNFGGKAVGCEATFREGYGEAAIADIMR